MYDAVGVGGGDDADKSTAVEELASGYLEKKSSGALRKWQTRFFQASGHYLKYFADSRMGEIKAVADLNELETIDHQAGERSFDLEFAHSAFHLRAPTQAEAHKWVAALQPFAARKAAGARQRGTRMLLRAMKAKAPLSLRDVQTLMQRLNAKTDSKALKKMFESFFLFQ